MEYHSRHYIVTHPADDRKTEKRECKDKLSAFVICEGRIWSREDAQKCYECGADAIVVGTAITNPKLITKRYVDYLKEKHIWE